MARLYSKTEQYLFINYMIELSWRKGIAKTSVKLYDDIDQMPVDRFNKANKYWMLHDNIGSSISDFDLNHFNKLALLAGDKEKCKAELHNFRILVWNIQNEINVEHLSFACLVHSINDKEIDDLSEGSLKDVLKRLSDKGLTQDILKKKLMRLGRESIQTLKSSSPPSL